jgi:hypothetical protein
MAISLVILVGEVHLEQVVWPKFLALTAYGRLRLILYGNPKLVDEASTVPATDAHQ